MAHPPKNSREDTIRHAPVGAGARRSDALDPEKKAFTRTPREIARSLKRSAERSSCPQSGSVPFGHVDADILHQSRRQKTHRRKASKTRTCKR